MYKRQSLGRSIRVRFCAQRKAASPSMARRATNRSLSLIHILGEVRFSGLTRTFPQIAEQLFAEAEEQCAARYAQYEKLAAQK